MLESTRLLSSNNTGLWTARVLALFSIHPTPVQLYYLNALLRKIGHFSGYAFLSWFAFRGWMETLAYQSEEFLRRSGKGIQFARRWHLRAAALAVLCTILVAGLDEFHQSFLPGRTGVVKDVFLDSLGGIFVQLILLLYWTRREFKPGDEQAYSKLEVVTAD